MRKDLGTDFERFRAIIALRKKTFSPFRAGKMMQSIKTAAAPEDLFLQKGRALPVRGEMA